MLQFLTIIASVCSCNQQINRRQSRQRNGVLAKDYFYEVYFKTENGPAVHFVDRKYFAVSKDCAKMLAMILNCQKLRGKTSSVGRALQLVGLGVYR